MPGCGREEREGSLLLLQLRPIANPLRSPSSQLEAGEVKIRKQIGLLANLSGEWRVREREEQQDDKGWGEEKGVWRWIEGMGKRTGTQTGMDEGKG